VDCSTKTIYAVKTDEGDRVIGSPSDCGVTIRSDVFAPRAYSESEAERGESGRAAL